MVNISFLFYALWFIWNDNELNHIHTTNIHHIHHIHKNASSFLDFYTDFLANQFIFSFFCFSYVFISFNFRLIIFFYFAALWVDMNKQISLSKMFCYVFLFVWFGVFRWKIHHKFWLLFRFFSVFYVKKKLCYVFLVCFKKMWKNLKYFLFALLGCILMMLHSFFTYSVVCEWCWWCCWCWWFQRLMLE